MTSGINRDVKDSTIDLVSGIAGGIAFVYSSQPLDTCKVKMQTFPLNYKHGYECLVQTVKHEGIRGLYAGTVPALIANTLEFSILFFAYGGVKKIMKNMMGVPYGQSMNSLFYATAGSIASVFASVATCPTDVVKARLQVQMEMAKHKYGGKKEVVTLMEIVADILEKDGMRGMFKGLGPSIAKEMPGYFVYFYSYEFARNWLKREDQEKQEIGLMKTMIAGSLAGAMFWGSTYPVDVIKSRVQVTSTKDNMFAVGYKIARNEGVYALFRGLRATLIMAVPANACMLTTFENVKIGLHSLLD